MPSGSETPDHAGQYGYIPLCVMADPKISKGAKVLYAVLDYHARQKGLCDPSHETLACAVRSSLSTVRRYLDELWGAGYISWTRRGLTKTNMYHLIAGPEAYDA